MKIKHLQMSIFTKKWIKKHKMSIIISFLTSIILAIGLGYIARSYSAFGGEDLLPIITIFYWILKYIEDKESEK